MAARLIIAPEVEHDLADAYEWYEERQPGLGDEFLGCVDACVQRIRQGPTHYAPIHENHRRALVRRFPYAIFYEFDDGVVTVYCVIHTSRDPAKWRRRLP